MKNVADILPLSGTQQGILFHVLAEPEAGLYIEQAAWTIEGDFDPVTFERAWAATIARQPMLRACYFVDKLEKPLQVVREQVAFPFAQQDWRGLTGDEQRQRLARLRETEQQAGFVLSRAPLLRVVAVRLDTHTWRIIWTWHHLILDGWSVSLLLAEVLSRYDAFRRGVSSQVPPGRSYRDYLAWLNGRDSAQAEAFWRETLRGCEQDAAGTPAGRGYVSRTSTLSPTDTARLRECARANRVSLNTVVQAAWALVLSRYLRKTDVLFGALVSGRSVPLDGVEAMLGLFVNALPLGVEVSQGQDIPSFFQQVQGKHLAARAFEHIALTQIQKWAGVTGGRRLFASLVVFDNLPAIDQRAAAAAGFVVRDFVHSTARTGYPLTLEVFPEDGLRLQLTASRSALEATGAERMTMHLARALVGMADGVQRLDQLDLLSPAERHQVSIEWNDTQTALPQPLVLHELVRLQVARTPDATAVVCGDERLTYRELDARSDAMAQTLIRRGAGPDVHVAICADRSVDLVAWLLAILKSGAAYVPLDPSYPPERLALMVSSCGAPLVIAERRWLPLLSVSPERVICAEDALGEVDARSFRSPPMSGAHAAYAIFTSGSTGAPKAAENTHAAIVNRLLWMQHEYGLTASDRVLQKTPMSFDVSVWEFFWPLVAGARLVMAAPGGHRDSAYIRDLIVRERITTVHFVPSMLRAFLDEPGVERCASLRRVIASGEALSPELRQRCLERLGARLHNLYGPTEAAVDVTSWDCAEPAASDSVPIGRPIENVVIRILDSALQPVPIGVPGELYIGGVALARRYLGAADRTAERFLPDPFARDPGARLYRTGDEARYRADGVIEFLGRLDRQMKVRGFRIEPGEIETALRQHPDVADAVVLLHEASGRAQLTAYYLSPSDGLVHRSSRTIPASEGGRPPRPDLRAFLVHRLPEYMVPASFVRLDAWPLSPSGKLDRRALPLPSARSMPAPPSARALTTAEKALAEIWAKVLGIPEPGPFDNFFDLGGDSILAMIASAKARQAGIAITVRDIFDRGTIAALTRPPSPACPERAPASRRAEPAASDRRSLSTAPLAPMQRWFFEHWGDDPNHFNQAVVFEIGDVSSTAVVRGLGALLRRHDALSLRFRREADGWKQARAESVPDLLELDLSDVSEAEQLTLFRHAATEIQSSLDITDGPLLRAARVRFGGQQPDLLLMAVHHLVVDGVSWRILFEDLRDVLEGAGSSLVSHLQTASFLEWAAAAAEHAQSSAVQAQAGYWMTVTRSEAGAVPVDFSRGPNAVASARTVTFSLSAEDTRALLQHLPRRFRSRMDEAIISALATVLTRWTGSSRVRLAIETHGRDALTDDIGVSRTVGWFTALFPVLLELPRTDDASETLRLVRDQLRAVPRGGLDYGWLRYGSGGEQGEARWREARDPEVLFNYLGQFELSSSPALRYSAVDPGQVRARHAARAHLLEINCGIEGDRLSCAWEYSDNCHTLATIEELSNQFRLALEQLVAACAPAATRILHASDVPLADLTGTEVASLTVKWPDIEDIYRLSPIQEGLLSHHLQAPESDAYFEQCTFTIEGSLEQDAFRRACQLAIERHGILRTSFAWRGLARPVQVVRGHVRFPVEELDWRRVAPDEQARLLWDFVKADRLKGFDLETAPLLRLALCQMADDRWVCVWTYHHLLLDAWSMALGVREIMSNYQALAGGHPPDVTPVRQYRDYIAWLADQDAADAEDFWTRKLKNFESATPLPGDAATRDASRRIAETHESCSLSSTVTDALMRLARGRHVTPNTIVQGAWALLLAQWSGRDDVCFGATMSCRPATLSGSEDMIGVFINTVPVRTALDPAETVGEWLSRLHGELSELLVHAATPLARVQQRSGVPRGETLFDSVLVFQNHPRESSPNALSGGLQVSGLGRLDKSTWPLMLVVEPGNALRLEIIYDSLRFDRTLILRLLEQLATLLTAIPIDPMRHVGELSAMPAVEAHQALVEWNDTEAPIPQGVCYHNLFEAQASRTPDALAVAFRDARLTYRELNRRANQIARCLRDRGVAPEARVGVCLNRSTDLVVARLAVLKAGAAYVPLDPALPPERLRFMIGDAGAAVVVTGERSRDRIEDVTAAVLCLDTAADEISRQSDENLLVQMSPDNLAYVIYTSGSTGRPKGVATAHAGFVNLVTWHNAAYRITRADRKSQLSGLGFDASVWEMWPYLAAGASVHIPDDETRADWPTLLEWMCANAITVSFFPTPLAEAVVDEPWPSRLSLRALLTGGDRLHAWPRQTLGFEFVNKYGPTEVTAVTTWAPFVPGMAARSGRPSIGRPIDNLQVYVLNAHLQPVPVGASGELYIGGVGLARGYIGRPDLTAERFVPNPFSSAPGARLYRTGDLVRWSRYGDIDFLGRVDAQLKIRGFRIEPGEIESALKSDENVRGAVVLARTDSAGELRLTAYIVPADRHTFSVDETRARLRRALPVFMVPSHVLILDAFPLTPNGKVDYRALPAPRAESEPSISSEYVAPTTPLERELAGIWSRVLRVERVGIHDNFFALGGDSILSIRVSTAAGQQGIVLSPARLFECPTIAELARQVDFTVIAEGQPDELSGSKAEVGETELSQRELDVLTRSLSKRR